jgi:hypothetical protein
MDRRGTYPEIRRMTERYVWPDPFDPKRPNEIDAFGCDFKRRLATAETLSTATVKVCLQGDALETAIPAMLVGASAISGSLVSQRIGAGDDGVTYTLIFAATTSASRSIEGVRDLPVARRWDEAA